MGDFKVHHVRFFEYTPHAIQCIASDEPNGRLALSRSDGSIEIWSTHHNWFQTQVITPVADHSVEAIIWCKDKLYSAGLHGSIHEYNLVTGQIQSSASSHSGAIWCLACNQSETQIVAGTEDGCVTLFNITEEGIRYEKAFDKQEGRILCIAWHSAENVVITGGVDNIRIWSATSGHAIQRLTLGRQERGKETIVWCLAVTPDFTIVTGDSTGKTCFWNGKQGTLIKSYQSHKADVLSLSLNADGSSVFTSGVDPALIQFEFIATKPNSDWKMWVQSSVRKQHSHDVRAVAVTKEMVISGGVDTMLVLNQPNRKSKTFRKIAPIPHRTLVSSSPENNLLMLMYEDYLELWQLGATSRNSEKNGEILALKKNPQKLLQIKAKADEKIVCSGLSPTADWIAYSDVDSLRIFKLDIEEQESSLPKVTLKRARNLHEDILPARTMLFSPGGSTLVTVTDTNSVHVISLDSDKIDLLHTFAFSGSAINHLSISAENKHLACADVNNDVYIYNIFKGKFISKLPHYDAKPSSLAFHPLLPQVLVAYCDQKLLEFNFATKEYSDWTKNNLKAWPNQWMKRTSKFSHITYHPDKHNLIWVKDEQMIAIIDKDQPFPKKEASLFTKTQWKTHNAIKPELEHAFHICTRYKYIMHMDILPDNYLLVVERPPTTLISALPPSLKVKKFGT